MPGDQETLKIFDIAANEAEATTLLGIIDKIDERMKSVSGISITGKTGNAGIMRQQAQEMAAGMQQMADMQKKLIDLENQLAEAKQRSRTPKAQTEDERRAKLEESEATRQQTAAIKDKIRYDSAEVDSIVRKRIELKQLQATYDRLSQTSGDKSALETTRSQVKALSDELKKLEGDTGRFQRNVGNYSEALKPLEEELKRVTAAMAGMQAKAQTTVQNLGARNPVGFNAEQWKKENTTSFTTAGGEMVSVLNEDAEATQKLVQQQGYLGTIVQKNEKGFASVTQQIRYNERALVTLRQAGLEGSEAFAQLREETIESAREMKEFQRQQKLLESELPALKALTLAAKGLGGAYAISAGAVALFAEGNEKVEKELNKLVAIMTILQGLNEAWELINESGAAIIAIRTAGTEALAAATAAYEFVVEGATVATVALNAALVASGIGAILVALGGLIYLLSRATVNTTELYEAQSKLNEQYRDYYEALVKSNEALGEELEKQDETTKNRLKIAEIDQRSIADQLNVAALKRKVAEEDKSRTAVEMEDMKQKLGDNVELRGEYDEQIRRVGRLRDLSVEYAAKIAELKSKGKSSDVEEQQLKNNEALTKVFETQASALKVKLDRFTELENKQEESEQTLKELDAEDAKFAHELYERKIKALLEINNIIREQQVEFLKLQQTSITGNEGSRVAAATAEKAIRAQIIIANRNEELRNEMLTGEERRLIREKAQQELYKLDEEFIGREAQIRYDAKEQLINDVNFTNEELLAKQAQYYQRLEQLAQNSFANRKAAEETDRDQRLKALLEEHVKHNPNEENLQELRKFNDQKLHIETQANNNILRAEEELTKRQLDLLNQREEALKRQSPGTPEQAQKQLKDIQDLEVQKNALTAKGANLELQIEQNTANEKIKIDKERLEEKRRLADQEIELGKQVEETVTAFVKGAYEAHIQQIERQIRKNNELHATESARIQNSSLQESAKAALMNDLARQTSERNLQLQRKENQERRKEAEFERDKAVLDVIGNTAIAITKAVAEFPLTGGMPWAAIAAAMGAAQVAAILAHPIPKFEAGTDFSPEGLALLHPGEMRIDPSGRISMTPDAPESLAYLEQGTKIIPRHRHDEMNDILLASILGGTDSTPVDDRLFEEMRGVKETIAQNGRDTVAAIKKQKPAHVDVHVDANFLTYIKTCL